MTNQIVFFAQDHHTVINGKSWPNFLLISDKVNQRKLSIVVQRFSTLSDKTIFSMDMNPDYGG